MSLKRKRRALVSVYDKSGVAELCRELFSFGYEIVSTGGTLKLLRESGINAIAVSDITGSPEMLDGRVKTLHPAVFGSILARRDVEKHMEDLENNGMSPIDIVIVNLYPFEDTVSREGVTFPEAIEEIDIGGVSLIRAAAKNHDSVSVLTSPDQYGRIISELKKSNGVISAKERGRLAIEAYKKTASYDIAIYEYFSGIYDEEMNNEIILARLDKALGLRYGENPHQKAGAYRVNGVRKKTVLDGRIISGKALSYNNLLDLESALCLARLFSEPCAVIIKHNNPCGVAVSGEVETAYMRAFDADPISAFGGIIALNRPLTTQIANHIDVNFAEAVVAPAFEESSVEILKRNESIRLIALDEEAFSKGYSACEIEARMQGGFVLIQDTDSVKTDIKTMRVMSEKRPSEEEWRDIDFAWNVCSAVKSNAIVLAKGQTTTGIGCGQMSRVDSTGIAIMKAGKNSEGSVMASDAFLPFPDSVEAAAKAGVKAIVQTGGSIRDEDVVKEADRFGLSMVFTGERHFKH